MPAEFHIRPRARGARSFRFATDLDRILIGRGEVCDVRLPHPYVSFHHATVQRGRTGYELIDHGSANGTWVRGRRVHAGETVRLQSGDRLALPGFLIDVKFTPGGAAESSIGPEAIGREIYLSLLRPELGEQAPRLEVDAGPLAGRMLTLAPRESPYLVGRDPSCDWEVPDREASREHLAVLSDGSNVRVLDHGSKNGVRINGKVVRELLLSDGDTLEVGRTVLLFRDPRGALLRRLSREPGDPGDVSGAFEEVERGDEAGRSSVPPPGSATPVPGGSAAAEAARATEPSGGDRQPTAPGGDDGAGRDGDSLSDEGQGRTRSSTVPADSRGAARDLGDFLIPLAPPPPTVARREKPASGTPDGTDTLIVALGIIVFVVCLIAIYLLLR